MSILDEARELQERVLARLTALEPARREYDELIATAKVLKLDYKPNGSARRPAAAKTSRSRRASGKATTRGRKRPEERKIASPGERREQVLQAVKAKPGTTIAEVASSLGLPDGTSLYRAQRQLVKDKAIRKDGAQMFPVS